MAQLTPHDLLGSYLSKKPINYQLAYLLAFQHAGSVTDLPRPDWLAEVIEETKKKLDALDQQK